MAWVSAYFSGFQIKNMRAPKYDAWGAIYKCYEKAMKHLILIIMFFPLMSLASSLNGIWQEDLLKTIKWNKQNRKVEEGYLEKLSAISGHLFIQYRNGKFCQFNEEFTGEYNGKAFPVYKYDTENATYKVLTENEFGAVIELTYLEGTSFIEMLNFDGPESMYGNRLGQEDYGQPGHRTYFKKVQGVIPDVGCAN